MSQCAASPCPAEQEDPSMGTLLPVPAWCPTSRESTLLCPREPPQCLNSAHHPKEPCSRGEVPTVSTWRRTVPSAKKRGLRVSTTIRSK